ncbi:MAG: Holliday junction branch migration protein RuvA [Muribaculaceae bacterium]|nr:Holliday junction branch migration protein RuvA [Muribaculaceae bacterium]
MIEYIKGSVAELTPTFVVLENNGIGYMVNISLSTYDVIARTQKDEVVRVYVYEAIREDSHTLFGFAAKRERDMFLQLIGVSGVGTNTARMILSSATVEQIEQSIATNNVALLKSVKGVGAKTAQRIIVDLKDKIKVGDSALIEKTGVAATAVFDEALAALMMLGFTQQQSSKVLKKLLQQHTELNVEQAIKMSLKMM